MRIDADVPEKIVQMANEGRGGGVDARGVVIPKADELRDDKRVKRTGGGAKGRGKGKGKRGKKKGGGR
jgi:hypothetical protein